MVVVQKIGECPANRQRQPVPTESASGPKYSFDACVHLFFLNELATFDLIDSHPYLLFEPLVVGKEPCDGLLHQFAGTATGPYSKLVELGFLIQRDMYFHDSSKITARGEAVPNKKPLVLQPTSG